MLKMYLGNPEERVMDYVDNMFDSSIICDTPSGYFSICNPADGIFGRDDILDLSSYGVGDDDITKIFLNSSVSSLSGDVFYNMTSLGSVFMPVNMAQTGYYSSSRILRVFGNCTSLSSIRTGTRKRWNNEDFDVILSGTTSIGWYEFQNVKSTQNLWFPDVRTIQTKSSKDINAPFKDSRFRALAFPSLQNVNTDSFYANSSTGYYYLPQVVSLPSFTFRYHSDDMTLDFRGRTDAEPPPIVGDSLKHSSTHVIQNISVIVDDGCGQTWRENESWGALSSQGMEFIENTEYMRRTGQV